MKQRGSTFFTTVIILALLGGLGASGYLNYHQAQQRVLTQRQTNDQLSQLQQQVSQYKTALAALNGSSGSPAAAKSVTFAQLGVKVTPSDPVIDLTYTYQKVNGDDVANLTTSSLLVQYPACKPGVALGKLVRRSSSSMNTGGKFLQVLGGYSFYYESAGGTCATDTTGRQLLIDARNTLSTIVFTTLALN